MITKILGKNMKTAIIKWKCQQEVESSHTYLIYLPSVMKQVLWLQLIDKERSGSEMKLIQDQKKNHKRVVKHLTGSKK